MKHIIFLSSFRSRCTSFRTAMFGGLVLFCSYLLPMAAQAEDSEPSDQASAVGATEFAEGKQVLAVTLLLAAALVSMERFCSWRLGRHHRRPNGAQPSLRECLPPLASGSSALFPSSPEAQRR